MIYLCKALAVIAEASAELTEGESLGARDLYAMLIEVHCKYKDGLALCH